ncbi:DUF1045 domain-containing protein [Rhodobacter maris]|uniref:Putative phosphonate metabolism protein n=1 Tax=Rhodobacter maris TaxID=446682 RepID=A0A285S8P2_9RHOB|nr:DUF1045 domain-containing protein [Rhodobacter maris]SOC03399.1 putative phosphonate metabolism protein [Rhodobacter maris]
MKIERYALYFAPAERGLAQAGAAWLGWDAEAGVELVQPDVAGIAAATEAPRKYGFHATLKAPFRLAEGMSADDLAEALGHEAAQIAPVEIPGLGIAPLGGRFLALRPEGNEAGLVTLAAEVVTRFEPFRAASSREELARRRPEGLTARQRDLLGAFGYPYVFEEYRFHMTLTGDLPAAEIERLRPAAEAHFAPHLARPFPVDQLCLFGEDAAGRFHLLSRHTLSG